MDHRLALLGTALLLAGCSPVAEEPPEAAPEVTVPELVDVTADVPQTERARLPRLARDSAERRAKQITVRVRNLTCQGLSVGSGVALDSNLLVTNRHVLAGAEELEVSTWNGRTLQVTAASVAVLGDIGIARVEGRLPLAGAFGPSPEPGDLVTAVGYPRGGPLRLSEGTVVDRVDGAELEIPGSVVRVTARIQRGNSGGPLLDRKGRIAGIVYAIDLRNGLGLAIPVDTFRRLTRVGGFEDVPPCGAG